MKTAKHQPFPELRSDRNPFTAYLSEPRTPPTHIKTGKAKYSLRSRCGHRHHDGLRFALESTNAADMKNSFTSKVLLLLRPSSRPSCVCFSSPARSPSTLIDRPKPSFTFPRRISLPFFHCVLLQSSRTPLPSFLLFPLSLSLLPKEPVIRLFPRHVYIRHRRRESKALLYTSPSAQVRSSGRSAALFGIDIGMAYLGLLVLLLAFCGGELLEYLFDCSIFVLYSTSVGRCSV